MKERRGRRLKQLLDDIKERICHILRRNCLLKHIIEGKIEVKGTRGRRRKQLLDDIKERICHILRRNCLLKHITEGKIDVRGGRGRRRKQLLDDIKETRCYWKLKEAALDRTVWATDLSQGRIRNE